MRKIIIFLFFSSFVGCSIPSLVRSPLEFLGLFRFFKSTQSTAEYTLGGAVSGLFSGSSVVLQNGTDSFTVSSDGNFTFPTKLKTGTNYDVSVTSTSTSSMSCTIVDNKGTVQTSDITNISITCGWASGYYNVGVSVSGISASITVQNNGTDSQTFSSAGLYKFSSRIKTSSTYAVTITSQTAGSVCAFIDPTLSVGNMGTSDVTVFIRCVPGYLNGGTIQSVAAANLVSPTSNSQNFYLRTMVGDYPSATSDVVPVYPATVAANLARFNNPKGMASDGSFVYVADFGNNLIRKINKSNGDTTTFAGGNAGGGTTCPGTTTTNCKDGVGPDAEFNGPFKLTTDGTSLYVLEFSGNRIRKINLATASVTTLAGNGNIVPFVDSADGILASFQNPHDITLYNGTLYVADRYNNSIRAVNPVTGAVSTFAGSVTPGYLDLNSTSARFNNPIAIVGLNGFLYVTDSVNNRIRRISLSGANPVTTFAGNGTVGSVDGFGTSSAQFDNPFSIATDGTDLFISDYNTYKIRHLRLSDLKVTTLVGGGSGYLDEAVSNARMGQPVYLISDGSNLYVSDEANHSIRRLENAEILRYTFDGNSNDSIGTNNGVPTGSPTLVTDENGTSSGAYEFDGTSQHMIASSNVTVNGSSLGLSSNKKFTISAWIYPSGGATDQVIFANGTPGTDGVALILQGTTRYLFLYVNGTPSGLGIRKIPLNEWSHVAITNTNDNWQIHINGISEGIAFNATYITLTTNFSIAFPGSLSRFKGKISNVRIHNGTLDATALQKLATQVPSGLLAYYPFNGNTNDYSGNENHMSSFGAPSLTIDRNGLSNSAYSFVAPNDYLEKTSPYGLPTGNATRTTCAWVRATSTPSNIVSFGTVTNNTGNGIALGPSKILHYGMNNDHGSDHFYLLYRWVHVCGTFDGANSEIYYNGSFRGSDNLSGPWNTATSGTLRIGRRMDASEFFSGVIDDVRIYNRALSASEIRALSGAHPLQINGLQLHLQADSLNTPAVGNWPDNSPNNIPATNIGGHSVTQAVAPLQPTWSSAAINGTPGVTFNAASNTHLTNSLGTYNGLGTDSFSFFIVNSRSSIGGAQVPMSLGPAIGGKAFLFDDSGVGNCGNMSQFGIAKSAVSCAAKSTSPFGSTGIQSIFSISYDTTSSILNPFYWDTVGPEGITVTPALTFVAPSGGTGITVGARYSPINYFDGIISEMIYFDRILSTAEADSVRCYLSRKYSIRIANSCQ